MTRQNIRLYNLALAPVLAFTFYRSEPSTLFTSPSSPPSELTRENKENCNRFIPPASDDAISSFLCGPDGGSYIMPGSLMAPGANLILPAPEAVPEQPATSTAPLPVPGGSESTAAPEPSAETPEPTEQQDPPALQEQATTPNIEEEEEEGEKQSTSSPAENGRATTSNDGSSVYSGAPRIENSRNQNERENFRTDTTLIITLLILAGCVSTLILAWFLLSEADADDEK
ncbi:hypothetical protein GC174_08755 [bacterium]|nr:hypothetical protein [bacterium]